MADWRTRSFWLQRKDYEPGAHLDGDISCDVVIVGGGFTGLWSAIALAEADPSIDIVVLEQKVVGYGASGRNGGFAMTMMARNIHDLTRKVGEAQARAMHLAMRDALHGIVKFTTEEGIDADITNPGLLTVSNSPAQDRRIQQDVQAAERLGLDDFRYLTAAQCRDLLATDSVRCGHWEDDALLVDPAALTRGLSEAAQRRGVRVIEQTPVDDLQEVAGRRVEARTPYGTVRADRAVVATNAYAYAIPWLRRFIFTIYAYINLTEPLTEEQWSRVGWERRMGVEDKRIMLHFFRPTPDGRILWGGRDAPFSAEGPNPRRDRDPALFTRLEETFRETFPQLDDVRMDRGWAGPVCGTINCMPSVGWLGASRRIAYGLGYAGHGVGPSFLVGRAIRDLMLNWSTELLELPIFTKKPVPLPPGNSLRAFFLDTSQHILQRADDEGVDTDPLVRAVLKVLQ